MPKMIYETMMEHTADGGNDFLVMGPKGQGKTLLLQHMARDAFRRGEKVIWAAKDVDTWSVFSTAKPGIPINLIVQGTSVKVEHVPMRKDVPPLQRTLVTACDTPMDAFEACTPDAINVVVTAGLSPMQQAGWWTIFYHTMKQRKSMEWISVFLDEADQLFPAAPHDEWWHITKQWVSIFGTTRKKNISTRMSVHDYASLFSEISMKISFFGYVKGARAIPRKTAVKQYALNRLEVGYPMLASGALFNILDIPVRDQSQLPVYIDQVKGFANFDIYAREDYWKILDVQPHWQATCGECGYSWTSRTSDPPRCPRCGHYESIATAPGLRE